MQGRSAEKIRALNSVVASTRFAAFAYPDPAEMATQIAPALDRQAEWLQKRGTPAKIGEVAPFRGRFAELRSASTSDCARSERVVLSLTIGEDRGQAEPRSGVRLPSKSSYSCQAAQGTGGQEDAH